MKYKFKEYSMGYTITKEGLPPYRLPDTWWRKPLVWCGILKPLYRPGEFSDHDGSLRRKMANERISNILSRS